MKSLEEFKKQPLCEGLQGDVVDTSDYKLSPSGRKVRTHRIRLSYKDLNSDFEDTKEVKESTHSDTDPPFVLVLRRKAIRMYPDRMKVAIYHNDKLDKYFSVPYGTGVDSTIQAEEIQAEDIELEESVMDSLHKIVKEKQHNSVKFGNGKTMKVDHFTASAVTQVHNALNDDNKKKFAELVHKSPEHFHKAVSFALKHVK